MEFLQVQLEQERVQREDQKRNHEKMLKSLQSSHRESVIGKEEANKQLDQLQEEFRSQYTQLQEQFE